MLTRPLVNKLPSGNLFTRVNRYIPTKNFLAILQFNIKMIYFLYEV